jgi:hypothetical protein
MLPMPCAHKLPSQHFLEYLFLSLHRQALPFDFGLDLDGLVNFRFIAVISIVV